MHEFDTTLTAKRTRPEPLRFRGDIEGMRGVAVLLVLLYHCELAPFPGGYVGVDVFFVVSGYLITRMLLHDLERGTFSFKAFYVRRIRRLFPAVVATTIFTAAAGLFILSPSHLRELGSSSIAAILSASNFYFSGAGGYFATSAKLKPLLHTWSLAVEEQFYLLWPLSLWLIYKSELLRRLTFPLIGIAALVGILLSQLWIGRNPAQAYFLLPFRAHQLLIGALALGFERGMSPFGAAGCQWLSTFGLAFLLLCATLFGESTPFPGFASAVPAIAGFLMIVGGSSTRANRLLEAPALKWMGRSSYSIYLAHWPIISYARYLGPDAFGTMEQGALFFASVAAGALLHYGVESRWRLIGSGVRRWDEVVAVGVVGCAAIALAAGFVVTNGWPQRMNLAPEKRDYADMSKFAFLRDYRDGVMREGTGESHKTALIFGDSMMQNYVPALMNMPELQAADVTIVTRGGCVLGWGSLRVVNGGIDRDCRSLRDKVFSEGPRYDLIIWAQNWAGYSGALYRERESGPIPVKGDAVASWREIIDDTLARLKPRSGRFVIFGPPLAIEGIPDTLDRIGLLTDTQRIRASLTQMKEVHPEEHDRLEEILRAIAGNALVIDPRTIVCPNGVCRLHNNQFSYFADSIHFTVAMTPIIAPWLRRELDSALLPKTGSDVAVDNHRLVSKSTDVLDPPHR